MNRLFGPPLAAREDGELAECIRGHCSCQWFGVDKTTPFSLLHPGYRKLDRSFSDLVEETARSVLARRRMLWNETYLALFTARIRGGYGGCCARLAVWNYGQGQQMANASGRCFRNATRRLGYG